MYDPARQFPLALLICLLDIVESTTIARSLAIKNNYKLEGTQELRGLGLANLGGAIFNCYTTTGSFSRSAVNNDVGAKTQLAGMVTGLFIMITLLCLTEVFQNMSANVQGAIVIIGVFPLFDIAGFMYYWRINKLDWFCWVVCFIVTAFEGAEIGIASAIGASVVIFILKTAFPRIRSVAPVPGDENLYSSDKIYPGVDTSSLTQEGIIAIRVEAPLFFANAPFVRDNIEARILRAKQDGLDPKVVIMDLAPATDCDGSACIFFRDYLFELKRDGLQLVIANPTEAVLRAMDKAKLITSIGPQNFQATMPEAVSRAREIIAPKATEVEQKV